jgi:two-component system CheB/CheR fusion protein
VIPPARSMVMDRDKLQLHPRNAVRSQHRPVDAFLCSLAEFHGNCAVGVLLSGTGSDGVEGLEEIKSEGGITFAQDSSAQYDGMPSSAIAAGCIDFVLSPEDIAAELVRLAAHPYVMTRRDARRQQDDASVARILRLVHEATGVDFSNYKATTLQRRLTRRMLLQGADTPEHYLRLLRANPREVQELYRDFLINVTRFFRDPEAFQALERVALPELLRGRGPDQPVRVWTLGCATGEEAYSLAIVLHEHVTREKLTVPIQVFATDLSDKGIEWARAGFYPRDIANNVSADRLERYFEVADGGYRIGKTIRELCVFARQNVLSDAPFSRMDLVSCRNLLIYLEPVLQQRVLPLLHYALRPGGFLWLGSAETVGSSADLFEARDSRHRLYQARRSQGPPSLPPAALYRPMPSLASPPKHPEVSVRRDPARDADRVLLARYVPASALVAPDGEVLQFRGDTAPYLQLGGGRPSLNIFKMARDGLLVPLREAIHKARDTGVPVVGSASSLGEASGPRAIEFDVLPILGDTAEQMHFLVVFRSSAGGDAAAVVEPVEARASVPQGDEALRLECARLTQELHATRDYLHALLEQRDASNEELQTANEEAQSANEELQSINEELQTTKEEMESANEELLSVNDELQNRHEELTRANDDLNNIIASTGIALVTVGPDLRIRRFTPAAQSLFRLISTDVGRPLGDLKLSFGMDDIETALVDAMREQRVTDREVRDRDGRWHALRIRPYRAADGLVDGAVLVLVDIEQLKRGQASLRESQKLFSLLMEGGTGIAIILLDQQGRINGWNSGAQRLFQYEEAQVLGQSLSMLYGADGAARLAREMDAAMEDGTAHEEHAMQRRDGASFWTSGVLTTLLDEDGKVRGYSKVVSDVSGRHRVDQERQAAEKRKDEFLSILAHELRNPLAPIRSSLQVLDNPGLGPEQARLARAVMKRQITHMVRLIDDLLDVARIAKGKIEFLPEPLDLASAIEDAVQSAKPVIALAGQELDVRLPASPALVYGDPVRLAQAISNLLLNASRYSPDGGRIELELRIEPEEFRIAVRDHGIGIESGRQDEIFELFAQGGHVPGRMREGLGIGLTMVRLLVEMHGGRVCVRSDGAGAGSEFTISLPRPRSDLKRERGKAEAPTLAPGQSILLVDDNQDAADALATALRLQEHKVLVAYDAERALELVREQRPGFALLDLGLPGIDGLELCRRLRVLDHGSGIICVALTGWGQEADKQAALDAGFDLHLTKPVEHEKLLVELEKLRTQRA